MVLIAGTFYKSAGSPTGYSSLRTGATYNGAGNVDYSGGTSIEGYRRATISTMSQVFTKASGQDTVNVIGYTGRTDVVGIILRAIAIIV